MSSILNQDVISHIVLLEPGRQMDLARTCKTYRAIYRADCRRYRLAEFIDDHRYRKTSTSIHRDIDAIPRIGEYDSVQSQHMATFRIHATGDFIKQFCKRYKMQKRSIVYGVTRVKCRMSNIDNAIICSLGNCEISPLQLRLSNEIGYDKILVIFTTRCIGKRTPKYCDYSILISPIATL